MKKDLKKIKRFGKTATAFLENRNARRKTAGRILFAVASLFAFAIGDYSRTGLELFL